MEKISPHQFMTLGAAVLMGITFLPVASNVTRAGGRDGWMAVLPGFAIGIPYGLMLLSLLARYPRRNLLQISEELLGKWIGKAISCVYILIASYFGGLLLAQAGDVFQESIMPLTPRWLFCVGALLIVVYLVSSGIEVFARFAEVVFPVIVIALCLNVVLFIPRVEQGELLPILSEGFKPLFSGLLKVMPFSMSYIFILSGILSFLPTDKQELRQLKRGVWRAVFLVGIIDTLIVLMQILVFGPTETTRLVYGLLTLGKMVEISRTFSGIESLFMGVWLGAWIIKISAFFFATIWGLETVFNLKGLKWNLVVGAEFLGITFVFVRGPSLIREIGLVEVYVILPFVSVWVLTVWGFSRWKKRAGV